MSSGVDELDGRIQAYIKREVRADGWVFDEEDEAAFGRLALELFVYQYEHNTAYRRFCRTRGAEPGRLTAWSQIPAVPLNAFRELALVYEPAEHAAAVFLPEDVLTAIDSALRRAGDASMTAASLSHRRFTELCVARLIPVSSPTHPR
jgi:hypothetical protein